jgi:hypothetical protein
MEYAKAVQVSQAGEEVAQDGTTCFRNDSWIRLLRPEVPLLEKRPEVVRHEWEHKNKAATGLLEGLEEWDECTAFCNVEYAGLANSVVWRRHERGCGDLECYYRIRVGPV